MLKKDTEKSLGGGATVQQPRGRQRTHARARPASLPANGRTDPRTGGRTLAKVGLKKFYFLPRPHFILSRSPPALILWQGKEIFSEFDRSQI